MKKTLCLLMTLLMVASLAACGNKAQEAPASTTTPEAAPSAEASNATPDATTPDAEAATPEERKVKDKIVFSTRLDFTTMDVTNTPSTISKSVYNAVYNTLVERDVASNDIIPALAESWTMDSETEYTFKLRQGVKFHDGSPFTADDVKFTYERAKEQDGTKGTFEIVDSVEAVDEYTVKVTLKSVNMDFLDKLTDPSFSIMSKTAFDTLGEEQGIQQGTGPYKYKEWNQGSYLDLEANEDYWDGAPVTKELRLQYVPESTSRLIAVQSGEMDFIQDPPMTELDNIRSDSRLKLITYPSASVELLYFNTTEAPMDNPDVRKAVECALNRQDIVDGVFFGNAIANNNIMHSSNSYYSDISSEEYNVEKARELLAQAGYPDGLEITLISNTNADSQSICTIVQAMLADVGITVKYEPLENATHSSQAASHKGFNIDSGQWSAYAFGPDTGLRGLLHSDGVNNYSAMSDAKMDQMLDEAITIADQSERIAAYKAIEEYSEELMTVYPVCVKNYTFVSSANMEDIPQPNGPIINLRNLVAYED